MNLTKDQIIIDKVLNGQTNAFSALVDDYKDLVFTLAFRMMKDRNLAEEVSQLTFIKAFKNLNSFKGQSKFSSWIYRITYNTCLDELRKLNKNYKLIEINEYTENELVSFENVLDKMHQEELSKTIKIALNELPGEMAFLITLYYFEDYSIKEIAKTLNIRVNNAKVKLHRVRLKLADVLKQIVEPEVLEKYESK
jgi:RNA polymerase sigma-70 factor (ECF subfamily)